MKTKLQRVAMQMERQLSDSDNHSLLLDIYGMAFYYDTHIWPLFKSAPAEIEQNQDLDSTERSMAFDKWMAEYREELQAPQQVNR